MKTVSKFLILAAVSIFTASCSSVRVSADYDKNINFTAYKTYAFFKEGIDNVKLNDLDKKRILNAIDQEMTAKGFTKTDSNPQILVNIFTKSQQQVNVTTNNDYFYSRYGYYGWGYAPYWGPNSTTVSTSIEGKLYIDFIDTNKKALIWQGIGTGYIDNANTPEKKEAKIQDFVQKILSTYPPELQK
ncbi:DUF4136 domain-containing protein [Myroides odoratus]|uniref:DUF4136 domain-containing protein n=1 Tax=Myroides odoratus TaxID=256 RepID=UPI00333FC8C9